MGIAQSITVTASQKTSGPGVYNVTVPGITITLETWTHWTDLGAAIIIKDYTNNITPNITVAAPNVIGGAIDGGASLVLGNPKEAVTFRPYRDGISWSATG